MFLYGKGTRFYVFSSIVYVGGISIAYRTKFYGEGLEILALMIFACQIQSVEEKNHVEGSKGRTTAVTAGAQNILRTRRYKTISAPFLY
jgi:hypothetical protein